MTIGESSSRALSRQDGLNLRLTKMFDALKGAPREVLPSKYWEELNRRNLAELDDAGYANFKRTIARSYFTWIVSPLDTQIRFLIRQLPLPAIIANAIRSLLAPSQPPLAWKQSLSYSFLTRLLWEYATRREPGLLDRLEEPREGNAPNLARNGKLISQDLANSALEYRSVLAPEVDAGEIKTILELGPGYGRTAFVFLTLMPGVRYILADIPPALAISERYLSTLFPERSVFPFRPFQTYDEVRDEFEKAQVAFLLPHQLELLPDNSADLFINISSLHEMRMDQIDYYFRIIRRVIRKYAYIKQWKESRIPFEDIVIRETDYPVPSEWKQIYWRTCAVQDSFFEALFELDSSDFQEGNPQPAPSEKRTES